MKTLSIHRPSDFSRQGFTLVELLVVIVIIAILAGLAFPAFSGVIESGKKARAAAMCNQLATGMQAYYTEYSRWPTDIDTGGLIDSSAKLTTLATALNGGRQLGAASGSSADDTHNSRLIAFMSFAKKDYTSSSGEETYPVNPWDEIYYLQFDADYDNYLTGLPEKGDAPSGGSLGLSSDVAVWTADDTDEVVANSYE